MNQMTTGASNDFERATQIARDMVTRYGMTEELGPMVYAENEGEVFLGRSITKQVNVSEETMQKVDKEIRKIIDTQYQLARRLIEERQQRVDVSGERLALATRQLVERRAHQLSAARLVSPQAVIAAKEQALVAEGRALTRAVDRFKSDALQKYARAFDRLDQLGDRLKRHGNDLLVNGQRQVDQAAKLLESYSFHSVLNRGFALVCLVSLVNAATRTLQEQIWFRDIPLLRDRCGVEISAAYLKGRANYYCLARGEEVDITEDLANLKHWAERHSPAPSTPSASPETTVRPACARPRAKTWALVAPCGVGLRLPTTARAAGQAAGSWPAK